MRITESGITFDFSENTKCLKFDETKYYTNYFNKLPNAKGVDFILSSSKSLVFLEVKNCTGHEHDNNWRLHTNNSKVHTSPTGVDTSDRESLDVEISKKIAMSLTCLMGSHTKKDICQSAEELETYFESTIDIQIPQCRKTVWVILFLEGQFGSMVRTKKMILKSLQDSINKKLKWLNCNVDVVDTNTYRGETLGFNIL